MAGEDAGGVHGANRLGGNGVANSTVFGGIAGESMAAMRSQPIGRCASPTRRVIEAEIAAAQLPFSAARAATINGCANGCST